MNEHTSAPDRVVLGTAGRPALLRRVLSFLTRRLPARRRVAEGERPTDAEGSPKAGPIDDAERGRRLLVATWFVGRP
jgi:hypothetical protein